MCGLLHRLDLLLHWFESGGEHGSDAYDLKRLAVDGFDEYGEVLLPDCVRVALRPLVCQIDALDEAIGAVDKEIAASVKADESRAPSRSCFLPASSAPGTSPCGSPEPGPDPLAT